MKANELRIGNYYQWKDIASMGVGVGQITHGQQIEDYIDLKEGIPITSEWLEKFGFTELSDDYIIGRFDNMFETHRIFSETGKGYEGFNIHFVECTYGGGQELNISARNNGDFLRNIEYVHQLQNLYFALTDKELTIKNLKQNQQQSQPE